MVNKRDYEASPWRREDIARFWSKVARTDDGKCWLWRGAFQASGYGQMKVAGHNRAAHRIAYEIAHGLDFGALTPGQVVCHTCDNPPCVNPAHLFLGDHQKNARDMVLKGRCRTGWNGGEESGHNKLTAGHVMTMRTRYAQGESTLDELARQYGIGKMQVSRIVRGLQWKHLPVLPHPMGLFGNSKKLTDAEVQEMRTQYQDNPISIRALAELHSLSEVEARRIVHGDRRADVPGPITQKRTDLHQKLTREQVAEMRARYATGECTQQMLADEYGVSRPQVTRIIQGLRWQ